MLATPLICAALLAGTLQQDTDLADMPPRDAAVAVARWLDSVQVETEHGIAWPVAPADLPDIARNLYSGTPGVILFFIELHRTTGDDAYLEKAKRGGDDLLAAIPESGENLQVGLYTGIAGQGFVLNELYKATKDKKYREGANQCVDLLVAHAMDEEREDEPWGGVTDIIGGAAGAGCLLLYAHREMEREDALEAAVKAGDWLAEQALPVDLEGGELGFEWAMSRDFPRMMPNFSHGTAGVAYFLIALHQSIQNIDAIEWIKDTRFGVAGNSGFKTLASIADSSNGGFRVYHHRPDGTDLFYLGWCHGPVGTARLFVEVLRYIDQENQGRPLEPMLISLTESGIPAQRTPGFWNNVGQCCGSAGVASFAMSLHDSYDYEEAFNFALAMHRDLMQRATLSGTAEEPMLSWTHAEHRVRPDFLQAQTGFMQGAAGIGLWLLQLDAHHSGRQWTLQFPDSPW